MSLVNLTNVIDRTPAHRPSAWRNQEGQLNGQPDMGVLHEGRRTPPVFPLAEAFGESLTSWIEAAAEGANCPVDYVAGPLLAAASASIGNARTVQAFGTWQEPCILWFGLVGDPSAGKSPGADTVLSALRWLEGEIADDQQQIYPVEADQAEQPEKPRIIVNDATPEAVAKVLSRNQRGVLLARDELSGWFASFGRYEGSGRAFWVEAFGGRSFSVDRVKLDKPVRIPRLSASVLGNIQPQKLEGLFDEADDGLAARFLWIWPDPRPFRRPTRSSDSQLIQSVLRRLHSLSMTVNNKGELSPIVMPLCDQADDLLEAWCIDHQKETGSGFVVSALGKMRGQLLRLALTLEYLWWAANEDDVEEPQFVGVQAVQAAAMLMNSYFKPMSFRTYGDAALPEIDRNTASLARWIVKNRPAIINARSLRRDAPPTPQLRQPEAMADAIRMLVEAGWLIHAGGRWGDGPGRVRSDYAVNPLIWKNLSAG